MAIKSPSPWQELTRLATREIILADTRDGKPRRKQRPFSGHRPRGQARRTIDSPSDRRQDRRSEVIQTWSKSLVPSRVLLVAAR